MSEPPWEIRRAEAGDLDALLDLYQQLNGEAATRAREDFVEVLDSILAVESRQLLVAEKDGRVIGTADGVPVLNLTRDARPYMIIENMVVSPQARRMGVGRALIDRLVEYASQHGCYKVQLLSNKTRVDAHAFYESAGFAATALGFRRYLDR